MFKKYKCTYCGYVYYESEGDLVSCLEAGTKFEDIPSNWVCPVCGVSKGYFALAGANV